jgi:hypothetical protein
MRFFLSKFTRCLNNGTMGRRIITPNESGILIIERKISNILNKNCDIHLPESQSSASLSLNIVRTKGYGHFIR